MNLFNSTTRALGWQSLPIMRYWSQFLTDTEVAAVPTRNVNLTDALDRFGTRLEHRMTQAEIKVMMERAGLTEIRFSPSVPFWCAVGRKA